MNIRIRGLSNYLSMIKKHNITNFISRGESTKYEMIQSGIFRKNDPLNIAALTGKYYDIVGNSLTDLQKRHFLAFSQHHGIPTNLIDFTLSPLISLFFACQDYDKHKTGYVYFISNNRLIDISKYLSERNETNCLLNILSFEQDSFELVADFIRQLLWLCMDKEELILDSIDNYKNMITSCDWEPIKQLTELNYNSEIDKFLEDVSEVSNVISHAQASFLLNFREDFNDFKFVDEILRLLVLLRILAFETQPASIFGLDDIRLPFYFTYNPPIVDSRIANQSSIFIQQQYMADNFGYTLIIDPLIQQIYPDVTFEIYNKKKLLIELDCLGINEKFVFNDYDNIAKYIRKKYFIGELE